MHPTPSSTTVAALNLALLATCVWVAAACASVPRKTGHVLDGVIVEPLACTAALARGADPESPALSRDGLRMLSWNVQKQPETEIEFDLERFAEGADLVLLQEATRSHAGGTGLFPEHHGFFAPGYRSRRGETGVLTASRVPPLTRCRFQHVEPWLRTPKATNVTEYALEDREETLLVVNLHVINFTLGVRAMQEQLVPALQLIEVHEGPVILSGDLNTWSGARERTMSDAFERLGLEPISYLADQRTRIFGRAVDHVWVKGVEAGAGMSHAVDTSDHNPVWVDLILDEGALTETSESDDSP